MQDELKNSLSAAISQYNAKRTQLLQAALQSGGQDAVQALEDKYDALRNAYNEILQKELDENNAQYEQLTSAAATEVDKLKESVQQLNNINDTISLVTSVLNLVARVMTVLA